MKEQKKQGRFFLKNDVLFIAALLIVCAVGMFYLFVLRDSGDTVKVTVDGELYGIYSLSDNIQEDIVTGKDVSNLNRFVILDGKVYMEDASCPDGICVAHRPIFREGESIVCLPNKVVITVFTEKETEAPDIVA